MIYGYLRVSSDEQDVNNQKQGVIELAKKNNWEIEDWISDEGVSGTKDPDKRQLGILMKRCNSGDTIICSELSRLGRKMLMVMSILEYCMKNGIMIHTVKDNYVLGDNIQSTVLAFAFSLASQIERDMISMRTKEALVLRKKMGVLMGTPRNARKIHKVSDEMVDEMSKMAEEGISISKIGVKMNLHRITVGYYLAKSKTFKGALDGYNIEFFNGTKINLTKRNCTEYGLYYKHISDAYQGGKDMSYIGIKSIEPNYRPTSKEYARDEFSKSFNPKIDRDQIEFFVLNEWTIPEIHNRLDGDITYDEVYDYISGDTYLSNEYRLRGQLKCKSKRVKY
jgi:DNA invertase Pin-like site-specific DNA recombinase